MSGRAWNLMRTGHVDEGIERLERAYSREPSGWPLMELGAAYLWLREFRKARRHFLTAIAEQRIVGDIYYVLAGTASWCLRDREKAVTNWRDALSCGYTDGSGGITPALLLFFASTVHREIIAESDARELLAQRLAGLYAHNWPGPLGEFVLGRIDDNEAVQRYPRQDESDELISRWQTRFYVGVLECAQGRSDRYLEIMRCTARTTDEDFDARTDHFLRKLRHAEFYIARHEARALPRNRRSE